MAMACSSAMLVVPPFDLAAVPAGSASSRVSTARVGGSSLISEGDGGTSGGGPLDGGEEALEMSSAGALSEGLRAALLAAFLAAFLVAAFGIGNM
jgi:hypothetical protein